MGKLFSRSYAVILCLLGILIPPAPSLAYEYATHHGITKAAREYLLDNPGLFNNDPMFYRFLANPDEPPFGFGDLIDTRAGDATEGAWTDEGYEKPREEGPVSLGHT